MVGRLYDAFNSGDYQASLDLMAPDIEYHELEGFPGARGMVGIYRGRDEVARWFAEVRGAWEPGFQSQADEVTELKDGKVLVVETWRGRAVQSGATVSRTATAVYVVRESQISEIRYFGSKGEALEAVGLSE